MLSVMLTKMPTKNRIDLITCESKVQVVVSLGS